MWHSADRFGPTPILSVESWPTARRCHVRYSRLQISDDFEGSKRKIELLW